MLTNPLTLMSMVSAEEKSLGLLKCFREIITLADELRMDDFTTFYPRIE